MSKRFVYLLNEFIDTVEKEDHGTFNGAPCCKICTLGEGIRRMINKEGVTIKITGANDKEICNIKPLSFDLKEPDDE